MHLIHDYVAKQLADKIRSRRIVVWYDQRNKFAPFVAELTGSTEPHAAPAEVVVDGQAAKLSCYTGSFFELRAAVEGLVAGDLPAHVVLYLGGCARDRKGSVLMELELAGTTWEPQLQHLARNLLLRHHELGAVDRLLPEDRQLSYQDLAEIAADRRSSAGPSVLRGIFADSSGRDGLLASWLASEGHDAAILAKGAVQELGALVRTRLGLELPEADLSKWRAITRRYVLANEFRGDLSCAPPTSLDRIPHPPGDTERKALRALAQRMRASFPQAYVLLADQIEAELQLAGSRLPTGALGAIDTFRFEERALLTHAGDLVATGRFADAITLVTQREHSFWLDREVSRKAHWEAIRTMAELGMEAERVHSELARMAGADAATLVDAYVVVAPDGSGGWYRLDRAQRRLEAWVATLGEDPDERPLGVVRRGYDEVCHKLAVLFSAALERGGWAVAEALHQTKIFGDIVQERPKPVAYFLVDAMRFEMGLELAERFEKAAEHGEGFARGVELTVRAAIGSLPSITPIGMAALMPGASASFSVVEQGGRLGALIDGAFLADLAARRKFATSRIAGMVDLTLDDLLAMPSSKLAQRIGSAQVVMVRSQEIDHAGETGFVFQARRGMDAVIDNIKRALGKLAAAGVHDAVVTADHGHLFFSSDRDASMRTDAPGGATVELHRRCWIGRGGATTAGAVRVSARALGYDSDLELVFPAGAGVFKAGGGLAFYHGGTSLQELVIPVLTIRRAAAPGAGPTGAPLPLQVSGEPEAVTNRIFSVKLTIGARRQLLLGNQQFSVQPVLISGNRQVGAAGMVAGADLDRETGCVTLDANAEVTVGLLLADDSVDSLRVVVLDPATDAELYRSPHELPVRLGM